LKEAKEACNCLTLLMRRMDTMEVHAFSSIEPGLIDMQANAMLVQDLCSSVSVKEVKAIAVGNVGQVANAVDLDEAVAGAAHLIWWGGIVRNVLEGRRP
jgi:hypothetical protein